MNLELALLHSFVRLAELEHFGQTAEELHISQPALTKQIKKLEERVGGRLVDRDTRHFELTAAGRVLLESARSLLARAEQAERKLELALEGKAGILRVGFGTAPLSAGLGPLLREFRTNYPHVEVNLTDMSSPAQVDALEKGDIDVGFVRIPVNSTVLTAIPLLEEKLVLAYPENHKGKVKKGLQAFRQAPFVAIRRSVSSSFNDHLLRTCRAAGFTPKIVQEAGEIFTLLHLVGAGLGAALVPESCTRMGVPHVKYTDTQVAEAGWKIGITYPTDRSHKLVENFVELACSLKFST